MLTFFLAFLIVGIMAANLSATVGTLMDRDVTMESMVFSTLLWPAIIIVVAVRLIKGLRR